MNLAGDALAARTLGFTQVDDPSLYMPSDEDTFFPYAGS